MLRLLLVALLTASAYGQTVMYGGRAYNGPVCRNPRCAMCAQIRAAQASVRMQQYQPQPEYHLPIASPPPVVTAKPAPLKAAQAELGEAEVSAALELLRLTPDDVFADIGCGRGKILIEAVRRYGCRAVGIEIDPVKFGLAQIEVLAAYSSGEIPAGSIRLVKGDASKWNPSDYGVTKALAYLWPDTLAKVWPAVNDIPVIVVPFHGVPGVTPTARIGDMSAYVASWETKAAPPAVAQPQQEPRVLLVVTDPAICEPCRRLTAELRNLPGTQVVTVRSMRGVNGIPTLIYRGQTATGFMTTAQIQAWMRKAEH